jgi:hypothetical protein
VTLGFSRPELRKQKAPIEVPTAAVLGLLSPRTLEREYKVVKINAKSSAVQSMKIRQV